VPAKAAAPQPATPEQEPAGSPIDGVGRSAYPQKGGNHRRKLGWTRDPARWETLASMHSAAAIVLVLLVVLPAVLVGGLFVWAALKDGQEDRALQARLGIRRQTRLGR
jgi:hypothetical protein